MNSIKNKIAGIIPQSDGPDYLYQYAMTINGFFLINIIIDEKRPKPIYTRTNVSYQGRI